jgi:high-affinity Fe2+/Pb2+ permease
MGFDLTREQTLGVLFAAISLLILIPAVWWHRRWDKNRQSRMTEDEKLQDRLDRW